MNWYYVLFGFAAIVIIFLRELYVIGWKSMQWPRVALRYAIAVILLFAIVHWHEAKEVKAFLIFAGIGGVTVGINWLINKVK